MSIKVTVGTTSQILPNAKEVNSRISSVLAAKNYYNSSNPPCWRISRIRR